MLFDCLSVILSIRRVPNATAAPLPSMSQTARCCMSRSVCVSSARWLLHSYSLLSLLGVTLSTLVSSSTSADGDLDLALACTTLSEICRAINDVIDREVYYILRAVRLWTGVNRLEDPPTRARPTSGVHRLSGDGAIKFSCCPSDTYHRSRVIYGHFHNM